MRTVVLGPQPPEVQALIERRRALGIDRFDEVWEGSYHMAPAPTGAHAYVARRLAVLLDSYAQAAGLVGTEAFNLGGPGDFRVPDGGYHRSLQTGTWIPVAAIVVEVVSPDDESYAKFDFYTRHGVEEILIADPARQKVEIWVRAADRFERAAASALLGVEAGTIEAAVTWPDAGDQ